MYPYHNRIIERIKNGELIDIIENANYNTVGECMLLVFATEPKFRPIRPHSIWRYETILNDWKLKFDVNNKL